MIGSAAQFLVQLPTVIALLRSAPAVARGRATTACATTLRAFVPVVLGRGSVQLAGYIDQVLASFLGESIVAAMSNAQTLYLLPVSLFGMAVSAAELPEMSSATGDATHAPSISRSGCASALRRVVFLVVPSAVAFVAIGGPIVALLFQTRPVHRATTRRSCGSSSRGSAIGLSAGTQGRLLGSAFYALGDPRLPLYAALVRVAITGGARLRARAAAARMRSATRAAWGAFGLTASAGFAAWIEFVLLDKMARQAHRQGAGSRQARPRLSCGRRARGRRRLRRRASAFGHARRARRSPRSRCSASSISA